MPSIELFIILLAAVVFLAALARRLALPHPVVLVLGGLAIGFIPGAPDVRFSPNLVFFVFLPPLVYAAAFLASPEGLLAHARSISLLATGLVLATMAAVAAVAHAVEGLPWAEAFVLGAVLGPTDPVAATAVARRLGAPQRLSTILEGEALINDGTGLAVFKIAIAAAGAAGFSLGGSVAKFFEISAGGIAMGVATAFLAARVRRLLEEPELEITTSIVTAYAAYVFADRAGFSGVLAAVAAGLYSRRSNLAVSGATARIESAAFWAAATFMLESLLFLLIGLEFPLLARSLKTVSTSTLIAYVAAIAGATIGLRLAWMFTVPYFTSFLEARVSRRRTRLPARERAPLPGRERAPLPGRERAHWPARERAILGWAGMRGGVSVAAALSIPLHAPGGAAFPDRALLIVLAYTTVLATLVLPALSLPGLISALGLAHQESVSEQLLHARISLAEAALARAAEIAEPQAEEWRPPEQAIDQARSLYEARLRRLHGRLGAQTGEWPPEASNAFRRVRRELLAAERAQLQRLRAQRRLSTASTHELERDLDLDESRLRG